MSVAPPTIVKLGGSIITRKREIERIRPKVLERLGRELAGCGVSPLIVLHGAGSFGHPGARRFHLARPPEPGARVEERRRGAAIVAREVRRLHLEVLRALIGPGLPAVSLAPNGLARNRAGALESLEIGPFERALSEGWVPVSFGDVVPDSAWGASILSADTLALELGRRLRARRVVFVSDVAGVLAAGPDGKMRAEPVLSERLLENLAPSTGAPDVTGGIRGKARVMLALAASGVPAGLISGLGTGAVREALRSDDPTVGTWAKPVGSAPSPSP